MIKKPKNLPPYVGKRERKRKDGSYGCVCNVCGYPVGDHDGYCSECGARVAETCFYYGYDFRSSEIPHIPIQSDDKKPMTLKDYLEAYQKRVDAMPHPEVISGLKKENDEL